MAQVVERKIVARGITLDGRQFTVAQLTHDRDIPGVGNKAFAVDVQASPDQPAIVAGFGSYKDAKRYVTGGTGTFDTFDQNGEKVTIEREGLYVPSAMIAETKDAPVETVPPTDTAKAPAGNTGAPRQANQPGESQVTT